MYQLLATRGIATNSLGEKFDVDYLLVQGVITIGDEIIIKEDSIDLLAIINEKYDKTDLSFKYAEYGSIVGIVASVGAIFLGNYKEPADYLLGFAVNILIYGIIGLIVGSFVKRNVPHYTFKIRYLEDNSIWTIDCRKEMFEIFKKFTVNHESEVTNNSDITNRFKSSIDEKEGQFPNLKTGSESTDSISKLEKYHDLYKRGVISEDEFNEVKKKILEKEMEK